MDTYNTLKRITTYIVCGAVTAAALYATVRYLLPASLPILIGGAVAALLKVPVRIMHKRLHIPEKLAAALAVTVTTSALVFLACFLISRGCEEIISLSGGVGDFIERLKTDRTFAEEIIEKISSSFPFWDLRPRLTELWLNIDSSLEALLATVAEKLSGSVIPFITGTAAFVPEAIFFVVVALLSAYYISVSGAKGKKAVLSLLPDKFASRMEVLYKRLKQTAGRFVQAYLLIMAITFTELFVMFSIAKIPYAFLAALLTAIVDLLPVLGTGTVLLPWAAFMLITGSTKTGVALLIIYGVVTLVRQLIEPRIVGESVGISPFASLASMYIGLRLFGALGLIVCPLAVIVLQNAVKNKNEGAKNEISSKKLL